MADLELYNSIGQAVSEAWSTLLVKTIAIGVAEVTDGSEVTASEHVSCEITYDGDVKGTCIMHIPKESALTMVGMMLSMGTDDELIESTRNADAVGESELDALKEAFNQFASTSASVIRDARSCACSARVGTVNCAELENPNPGAGEDLLGFSLDLEGFESSQIHMIIKADLSSSLENDGSSSTETATESPQSKSISAPVEKNRSTLDHIMGMEVSTEVILADRVMKYNDVMEICIGSVIEFKKLCDAPVNLEISGRILANGEVVTTDTQHFAVRLLEVAPEE